MKPNILIIEDNESLGDILSRKLTGGGYAVSLVTDGALGLLAIKETHPDLVLLDILLPSMNGYEILEAKKQDASIEHIPVIIISNSGQPVELQRTIELGAIDYFIKAQLDPDDIMSKVRSIVPQPGDTELVSLEGKKVLLVEDDNFLSSVLMKKLSSQQCELFHATSGTEAVEKAQHELPDVILLDLVLPDLSGFEILEKLKKEPVTAHIQVIVLSNLSQDSDRERVKALGADMFLVKSNSTPSEICHAIQKMLSEQKVS
jgi:CheY-like chemotaxis protein